MAHDDQMKRVEERARRSTEAEVSKFRGDAEHERGVLKERWEGENRELRKRLHEIEEELRSMSQFERERKDKQIREFEATFEDLSKELRSAQCELTLKDQACERA